MLKSKLLYFILLIYVALGTVCAGEHTFNVFFQVNKFKISESDKVHIQHIVDSLSKYNISAIKIVGHTDNLADSLYNIHLSNRRANDVREFLLTFGFNDQIIHTGFYGENRPITSNDYEYERSMNRRAEIIVTHSSVGSQANKTNCQGKDTLLRIKGGKMLVINKCDYEEIKNCLEIRDNKSYYELKKGIVIMNKGGQDLAVYGMLQVDLLDGCIPNNCFKTPVKVRFPLKITPPADNHSWALVKGEKTPLKLITHNDKLFYELELKCPTSWINCNCKKSQKH